MKCKPYGKPDPTVTWTFNNQKVKIAKENVVSLFSVLLVWKPQKQLTFFTTIHATIPELISATAVRSGWVHVGRDYTNCRVQRVGRIKLSENCSGIVADTVRSIAER